MRLTFKQIEEYKKTFTCGVMCAACRNPIENIWILLENGKSIASYFRCFEHTPEEFACINGKTDYYKLDEKEMFVFKL